MPIRIDSRILALITHDLRNPLNVIGLSLRMIEEEIPENCREAFEDIEILRQNIAQLARMLNFLSDYSRQVDDDIPLAPTPFDPRRFAQEIAEEVESQAGTTRPTIVVEPRASCPPEVSLDPVRSRVALRYALTNAASSASTTPVRVILSGEGDRFQIAIQLDRPPRPTVRSAVLRGDAFERLLGGEIERLGLDLAITARISDLLGGSARLDVQEGVGSTIFLDWPVRQSVS